MKELYHRKNIGFFSGRTEDIKLPFVEGFVREVEATGVRTDGYIRPYYPETEDLFFKIDSLQPEVTLTFRPHIRLDTGEKVKVYLSDSKRVPCTGFIEVNGIQILDEKGRVKFQAKRCADYIFK